MPLAALISSLVANGQSEEAVAAAKELEGLVRVGIVNAKKDSELLKFQVCSLIMQCIEAQQGLPSGHFGLR